MSFFWCADLRKLLNFQVRLGGPPRPEARAAFAAHAEIVLAVRALARMPADHTMPEEFWRGRRVLLTGHTGFKGAWLSLWLRGWGRQGHGLCACAARALRTCGSIVGGDTASIIGDVRDFARLRAAVTTADPQIVIHMAAQALVQRVLPRSARNLRHQRARHGRAAAGLPRTRQLGVRGGRHQRQGLRERRRRPAVRRGRSTRRPRSVQQQQGVRGAADGELPRQLLRRAEPPIASARAGNVIGGGDWSADRLIPDCVRALATGQAGRHCAIRTPVRPWQHVLEPLSGYLELAQSTGAGARRRAARCQFRTGCGILLHGARGGRCVQRALRRQARLGTRRRGSSTGGARPDLVVGACRTVAGMAPRLGIDEALAWTADWYRSYARGRTC